MPPHIGPLDRLIQIVPGVALVVSALSGKVPAWLGWVGLSWCLCRRVLPASARSSSIGR
ncbi:hypothetical protein LBW62_04890 [Ralstonia solanacearum]|uniref:hypothetical protein n=1 Tax=Ralstonia solanacearum TaxID=305 RepID=UPI000A53AC2F|nr:hypothetical protein [Ralstonia solanacearum]MDB0540587.1 hypothetical protein [Ralstonia solanacearum]MDB0555532.1 hypothetical protein [Ralstonia solanacearum]